MKHKLHMRFLLLDFLDLMEDFLFLANRPGMSRLSRYWGYTEMRAAYRAFNRWEAEKYLEQQKLGEQVLYRLTSAGRQFLRLHAPSASLRRRTWDGRWRMVMFDFPEVARKARDAFRRELKVHRMGCLQKSVWITPDPVIDDWKRLLAASELTEWVLLFESAELGPVEDLAIARRIWKLDEVSARYERYLTVFKSLPRQMRSAKSSTLQGELGNTIQRERRAYFDTLRGDPMLPSALTPKGFAGARADELHGEIRDAVRTLILSDNP